MKVIVPGRHQTDQETEFVSARFGRFMTKTGGW